MAAEAAVSEFLVGGPQGVLWNSKSKVFVAEASSIQWRGEWKINLRSNRTGEVRTFSYVRDHRHFDDVSHYEFRSPEGFHLKVFNT